MRFLKLTPKQIQRLSAEFPTKQNRELFRRNREFWRKNREFYQPNVKSSPDEVFGTHRSSFNQVTKPPTKAQQFVASGIPFGCNPDSSVAAYFRARGFDVADAADEARLTSLRYWDETRAFAPRLRGSTSIEWVGQSVLALLKTLLDHRDDLRNGVAARAERVELTRYQRP